MANEYIPIRFSHLLGYSGVGAIVRGPRSLMVVQDTSKWTDKDGHEGTTEILYVERVRHALGISDKKLCTPPTAKEERAGHIDGIPVPATRFPRWMRCPKCGRLYPQSAWKTQNSDNPVCTNPADGNNRNCQRTRLEQVQYIMVHPEGYLADVAWFFLAHKDGNNQCKVNDKLVLAINPDNKLRLRCEACGSEAYFNDKEPQSFGNANEQPWLYDKPIAEQFRFDGNARIRKVNDALVYNPITVSALVIPPESRLRKGTPVDLLYRSANDREQVSKLERKTELQRRALLSHLAGKYGCSIAGIHEAIEEINNGYPYYGQDFSDSRSLEAEYEAFLDETTPLSSDEDFVTRHCSAQWQEYAESKECHSITRSRAKVIQKLVKVDRLKEVRVFRGFKREAGDTIVPPDILGKSDRLPAIELYGEGIFFTLNEEILANWEKNEQVKERLHTIERRFVASGREWPKKLTARFLLLHTLSHLLIRQFEAVGGYPAASLAERLYCNAGVAAYEHLMSGILIYTTAPDKAGTLGGLAELTAPKRFLNILSQTLDRATWCSSDPVCSEHEGQGPGLLNLAACHACALVPDTACAYNNVLLDRVMVRGDRSKGLPSLFDGELD